MNRYRLIYVVVLIFFTLNTMAADQVDVTTEKTVVKSDTSDIPASIWSSDAELGYVKTTGNTTTEALHLKFAVNHKREDWEHELKMASAKNSDSTGITARRYLVSLKSQYVLSQMSYLFAKLKYQDDRFSGYKYQASEVAGYGRKLVSNNRFKLNVEAGMGTRQNKFDNGLFEKENVVLLASDLDWSISKTASLTEDISIEMGDKRTLSKFVTALKTQINNSLSSKITYTVRTASEVPLGTKKTDTELAVTLVYAFK